jgi:hypothetical protein
MRTHDTGRRIPGRAGDTTDVTRFAQAVVGTLADYRHTDITEAELGPERGRQGERCWAVETAAGPLSVSVLRFCNGRDIATVFMRFADAERAAALGLSDLNPCSGKWNIHEVAAAGRKALEEVALDALRRRLALVGVRGVDALRQADATGLAGEKVQPGG